jgi:hypothetical protein
VKSLACWLLLLLPSLVLGQGYRVDDEGGPLTLAEDLAAAADAWTAAAARLEEELVVAESAEAASVFRYADAERMGPDLVSLTLIPRGTEGLTVLLNPELYRRYPSALLHELGLLIGLPTTPEGVMNPLLEPDDVTSASAAFSAALDEEVLAALEELGSRVEGDINGDGEVGLEDLAELGRAYGRRGLNLPADLNGDGEVGADDVELLRTAYRFTTPARGDARPDPVATEPDEVDAEPE